SGYIFTWLVGYSALLGPIAGILIADYFVLRRARLNLDALYRADGEYRYTNGFSLAGLIALALAVAPNIPGFLVNVKWLSKDAVPAFLVSSYDYAWFLGFAVAFSVYLAFRKLSDLRAAPHKASRQITATIANE
ncbi:MAG TPA: cytosine permease, partial [Chthoniobacteraceae bacterium]|nr:cytosine permease [Chthoniobacteraceae bacterium]